MTRDEAIKLLKGGKEGVAEWNRRREAQEAIPGLSHADLTGARLMDANLSGASLRCAYLNGADFSDANLPGVNLCHADLRYAKLIHAKLRGADLTGADLFGASLSGANLSHANLSIAALFRANLSDANLSGADLSGAVCAGTTFGGRVDLCSARNVEAVTFRGPCTVGQDVLVAAKGRIPDVFLEGCGFQPWEILSAKIYDPALSPLEIADLQAEIFRLRTEGPLYVGGVFISYSHADTKLVDKLFDRLKEEKIRVWLDRHDLVAGPLQRQVIQGIRMMDVVVLVLSKASVGSDWVDDEVRAARVKEREEKREVLCPVALDDTWKKKVGQAKSLTELAEADADWMHLAKKNVLDFSRWESDDDFETQFKKLLTGMKIYYTGDDERMKDEG